MPGAIIEKRVKARDCTWLQEYDGIDSTEGATPGTWVVTGLPLALAEVIGDLDARGDCR